LNGIFIYQLQMGRYKLFIFFVFSVFFNCMLQAQNANPSYCYDISRITLASDINNPVAVSYIDRQAILPEKYNSLAFKDTIPKGFIPNSLVTKKAVIRFALCNTADTAMPIWFFPGFYCPAVQLYSMRGDELSKLPSIMPHIFDAISYRKITVPPHDTITIVAELTFAKTYLNRYKLTLIHPGYLSPFIVEMQASRKQSNLITYLFCGLLLMMILYSLANYFQGANKEFLYYSGYAFFLGLMLFLKALFTFHTNAVSFFQEEYLDFIMQVTGYLFYMIFMQKYLVTKTRHPFLHTVFNTGIAMLIASGISYSWFHFFTNNFIAENAVENLTKVLLLLVTFIFIIYSFRHWKDKLLRYLFWGNLCLFVFSLLSQMAIMVDNLLRQLPGVFHSSIFYYEIGLFLELVFFLMALSHKYRSQLIAQARETERLKADNLMKEYEKELAVFKAQQQERERISADMHDELGSGMTAIRLMSEIARNKMKEDTPVEIEKISQSADEVLNKMNAIIWSMNSGNDTMDNTVSYIRSYALEYFENTAVDCKVITPENIEPKELTGDKRRNIFLCIKETLNNALKHSKASSVKIEFWIDKDLVIKISDNGVGIDLQNLRQFGNGLKNIARRMESIGGTYQIENDNGTITTLTLPL
jgi:signal transduction histidine kinase